MCKNSLVLKMCVIFLSLNISILFLSCNNTTPSIGNVTTSIIYDYSANKEDPIIKMAVFVELFSDPLRIQDIKITSPDSNFTWIIENPPNFATKNTVWVGTSNIMAIQNRGFPEGTYLLEYTDVAQRSTSISFSVPQEINVANIEKEKFTKKMSSVYDKNDNLLYFGPRLDDNTIDLKEDYADAQTVYNILTVPDGTSAIIEEKKQFKLITNY